jgi:hypothetical protein
LFLTVGSLPHGEGRRNLFRWSVAGVQYALEEKT